MSPRRNDSLERTFLPSAPLRQIRPIPKWCNCIGSFHDGLHTRLSENQERAYHRAIKAGRVSLSMADDLCCALGVHPSELWGSEWFEGAV